MKLKVLFAQSSRTIHHCHFQRFSLQMFQWLKFCRCYKFQGQLPGTCSGLEVSGTVAYQFDTKGVTKFLIFLVVYYGIEYNFLMYMQSCLVKKCLKVINARLPEIMSKKGCDASNIYDEEIPERDQEYSDDEKEKEAKKARKKLKRGNRQRGDELSDEEAKESGNDDEEEGEIKQKNQFVKRQHFQGVGRGQDKRYNNNRGRGSSIPMYSTTMPITQQVPMQYGQQQQQQYPQQYYAPPPQQHYPNMYQHPQQQQQQAPPEYYNQYYQGAYMGQPQYMPQQQQMMMGPPQGYPPQHQQYQGGFPGGNANPFGFQQQQQQPPQ